MSFSDFSKVETLQKLNTFLADKSYIEGTSATQADVAAFKAFQTAYPEFSRWFNHIASKADEFESLPAATAAAAEAEEEEDDDDVDLFGSDDEEVDEAAEKLKAQRLAEYNAKKAAKPKPAAKSIVTLDVKPWDDETDLEEMLANVKKIEMDGLSWGAHQWIPIGFGIKKLQINLVVEDAKVSLDDLQQAIEEDEDHVQSTDVAAMQKL
ncbi:elongation factor 1-beta [Kluyveromyces marxianus DMKU3-1042]|uniref:Elongation factor 1-beta n=1 Tax=Kluyveromyces marxianus (strain DMKU3-1042 / BCC 29191 / NBRC 104275) TaxID=1003335 RepID=W0T8U0_KLUMD|nr:elongation factor 1-beta [Kluyveromyces marxianus DMKU3-1042]BAO40052.1 elongation factor 1-beta [Kluyveromyces marxianus DMKU3-1042]